MNNIKLVAIDIDGVLLEDTFSPVIRRLTLKEGKKYTREIERNVFSRPRKSAVDYIKKTLDKNPETTFQEMMQEFFDERDLYLKDHPKFLLSGVDTFLNRLVHENVTCICYGGLPENAIVSEFDLYMKYFDRYICTDAIRPGLKEITYQMYQLQNNQVLFIDDVNTVAEEAKKMNIPFIGVPANFSWGFQRQDMIQTGVQYLFDSVADISNEILHEIDALAGSKGVWN